ncbi:MAG: hypothetical protein ABSG83_09445 [Roseiarcus sp.]|jgi:hypothetical protein
MARAHNQALAAVLAAAFAGGMSGPARALDVGPKNLPLTVAGVAVQIPVAGSLDVHADDAAVMVEASATGDLVAIQDHALAIARGLRLAREPCAHKGLDVVVESIDAAKITPVEATAVVDLSGHVAIWLCKKILGEMVKAEIASDSVGISVPVELFIPDPRSVALRLAGPAKLKTGDALTTEAASALVGDVDAALTAQLSRLLDATRARAAVPPLPGLDVTIERAAFAQDGAKLTVRASGRAAMTAAAFARLLGYVGR